jgi:hypothetical protein
MRARNAVLEAGFGGLQLWQLPGRPLAANDPHVPPDAMMLRFDVQPPRTGPQLASIRMKLSCTPPAAASSVSWTVNTGHGTWSRVRQFNCLSSGEAYAALDVRAREGLKSIDFSVAGPPSGAMALLSSQADIRSDLLVTHDLSRRFFPHEGKMETFQAYP